MSAADWLVGLMYNNRDIRSHTNVQRFLFPTDPPDPITCKYFLRVSISLCRFCRTIPQGRHERSTSSTSSITSLISSSPPPLLLSPSPLFLLLLLLLSSSFFSTSSLTFPPSRPSLLFHFLHSSCNLELCSCAPLHRKLSVVGLSIPKSFSLIRLSL